ncbi:nuclear protein 1-like [Anarhichas minor]|uniref:nuclear protein 1-like n=1 Tax=Anarhichas minor TaxID=65739 RepID=UPI003F73A153
MPSLSVFLSTEGSARKGRTKKEASDNTNRHNPSGHERKIVVKLQNTEKKAKE